MFYNSVFRNMDKKVRLKKLTEQVTLKTASVHQIHFMDIPYTSEAQISKVYLFTNFNVLLPSSINNFNLQ